MFGGIRIMNATLYYQPIQQVNDKQVKRGRLGITRGQAIILFLVAGALFLILSGLFSSEVKADETIYEVITVQDGDSLWEIAQATTHSPDADIRERVEEIMSVNQLSDEVIYPGQNLHIPIRPNE